MTDRFTTPERTAEAIVDRVGRNLVLAIPVGIGKPVLTLNALYRLAESDRSIRLAIFTGLTLVRPRYSSTFEQRFVGPLLDRELGSWPDLHYAEAMRKDVLPPNVEVHEFFLQAGQWLDNAAMQQSYASLGYAHVATHLQRIETNVFIQLVAPDPDRRSRALSLSANTDVSLDMAGYVAARRAEGKPIAIVGELNDNLPFMPGEAVVDPCHFDMLFTPPAPHYDLFAAPKEPVSLSDYAMGIHAATLVKDGGTLQIGIGSFADALTQALILRHTDNAAFRDLVQRLDAPTHPDAELTPFTHGLYGCSEMLVDGFLALYAAGILKRTVPPRSSPSHALGSANGMAGTGVAQEAVLHAGFFIGSNAFYRKLRAMPRLELERIAMTAISFTNTLKGDTAAKIAQRRDARFINTGMTATLLGAVSSDQLEDGRVVSGVGGQADFVQMSHELPGARSIIAVRASRYAGRGDRRSNIVARYANTSIPRQLRDIVVTEYGIADIRGASDRECVEAMISVADSDFQATLQTQAAAAHKLPARWPLPSHARNNTPDRIATALGPARQSGLLPAFPLGTEMTEIEQRLLTPLGRLKRSTTTQLIGLLLRGFWHGKLADEQVAMLARMKLDDPATMREFFAQWLLLGAMGP